MNANRHSPDLNRHHEPGLTRRDWLHQSAAAVSTLLTTDLALAETSGRKPIELAVISDTHIGYRDQESARAQWGRTSDELARCDAKFVLHLGDVVDGRRVAQYDNYKKERERIGKPVHEIPGNHDPAEAFAEHLRSKIDTVVDHEWLRCVLLSNAHTDSHDGFFTDEQLTWLERKCDEAKSDDRLVVIACHVPVHANNHPDRGWFVKPADGQIRFYEIAKKHRERLLGVFHGHFHNGIRGWTDHDGLREVCFPSVLYNQDRKLEEQKAVGFNPTEFRPGYCLATIGDGRLTLRYKPTGQPVAVEKSLS